ncbi:SPOSA6832_02130 [Sporobolomyces salmonicolor]|uniref:Adenosine kinase n=1 Tax=Sporidiobolus salmonicolor TaxID=5005 RepID=A0A0D6ELJ9_SPOSA|nr:SPOSA6832_02130 [Sporobolomyces salmonicolor]
MSASPLLLLAMGNPLLDMQVVDAPELLEKYALKANDAVLAEGNQSQIYEDLQKNYKVHYVAGGAAQNAARGAQVRPSPYALAPAFLLPTLTPLRGNQYVLPANSTAYLGAVGADSLADQLRAANDKEGLQSAYQVVEDKPTGACAVVITGQDRSLCTTLGAAESFSPKHLEKPEIKALIERAQSFYLGGFFLTHGLESALVLAKHAAEAGKPFAMNLSAPFIPQFFKSQVDEILPYVDVLIGNESEAEAYAESHGWETKDIPTIATKLAALPKSSPAPRVVVITQGASSTVVATSASSAAPQVFPVEPLAKEAIVDTNGAGDAFAGGFLGARALGKTVEESVEVGHRLGRMNVQCSGPTYKWPKENVL